MKVRIYSLPITEHEPSLANIFFAESLLELEYIFRRIFLAICVTDILRSQIFSIMMSSIFFALGAHSCV